MKRQTRPQQRGVPGSGFVHVPMLERAEKPRGPAEYHDPETATAESVARHAGRYRTAIALLDKLPPGPVVDCACGTGYGTAMLAEAYGDREVWGVDRNRSAIEMARARYGYPVRFLRMDVRDAGGWLLGMGGDLAAIVCIETLEHLDQSRQRQWLERAWSALRRNGKLLVMCPIKEPDATKGGPNPLNRWHKHEPTLDELVGILQTATGRHEVEVSVAEYDSTAGELAWQATAIITKS